MLWRKGLSGVSAVSERVVTPETPEPPGGGRHTKPRRRRRLWFVGGGVLVLLLLVAFGAFVGAETVKMVKHAKRAQSSLEAFKTALAAGDDAAATRDLTNANAELAIARRAYGSFPLRVAGSIPYLGWPVNDAGHLLHAADHVSAAGSATLRLYDQVRGGNSKLFKNDTVSLTELHSVTADADGLVAQLDAAAKDLHAVHAASWEPSVGAARDKALKQVDSLRGDGRTAQRFLSLAPGLVGENGKKTYLVAVLNPAELQAAGGSALSMLTVSFDRGHMKIVQSGSTLELTAGSGAVQNVATTWQPLPGDPWLKGDKHVLASADRSPDWRTSGQELMRGYSAQFHTKLDGVIGIDPIALQGLLAQIGASFDTPGYGLINSGNLVNALLVDSYTKFQDLLLRHQYNNALMTTLLHKVLGGGHMLNKGKSLRQSAQDGHLQIYMNDPTVQAQVVSAGLLRTLPPPTAGDVIGVYTTNTNASKVDVWQKRTVTQAVKLRADGSVAVTRTIVIDNATPRYSGVGPDIGSGYLTRVSKPALTLYSGTGTKVRSVTVDGARVGYQKRTERGLPAIILRPVVLAQGKSMTVVYRYTLPAGTVRAGLYRFSVAAQPLNIPAPLAVSVTGSGTCSATGSGWTGGAGKARYTTTAMISTHTSVACRG